MVLHVEMPTIRQPTMMATLAKGTPPTSAHHTKTHPPITRTHPGIAVVDCDSTPANPL